MKTFDRNQRGKEKKVDVSIAYQITKDSYSGVITKGEDEIALVAGDKDYVPMVEDLVANGFVVDIVFWSHAAAELRAAASNLVDLNPHLEMPTKAWRS